MRPPKELSTWRNILRTRKRITVCDRWLGSFDNFLADIGMYPSESHVLIRIDQSKGWSPDNFRWREKGCSKIGGKTRHYYPKCRERLTWCAMKDRCGNPKCISYKNYGGRGIKVCDEWVKSFKAFFDHMGPKPSPEHSIDRINNDGNYEPGNCRWATRSQQRRNRRPFVPSGINKLSWKAKRASEGLCTVCGKRKLATTTRCQECRERHAALQKSARNKRRFS